MNNKQKHLKAIMNLVLTNLVSNNFYFHQVNLKIKKIYAKYYHQILFRAYPN